jgi:hypothetical protein
MHVWLRYFLFIYTMLYYCVYFINYFRLKGAGAYSHTYESMPLSGSKIHPILQHLD